MLKPACRAAPIFIGLCAIVGCAAQSQRVGQSTTVQFGIVRSAQQIQLDSNAAQGAIIGGTLGLARSRGGSSATAVRNGIVGATAGGVVSAAAEGSRMGMEYTVDMPDGSSTRIVTDQREIREGDCVAIERVGQTANIRRASASYCDNASERAVLSVADEIRTEAVECEAAKRQLAEAPTDEKADLAVRRIDLLCNG
jgi:outer membrane lipoprotein SlyB